MSILTNIYNQWRTRPSEEPQEVLVDQQFITGLLLDRVGELHISRVRPEGGFKNRNREPDLPKHNSSSYYQNQNMLFDVPVPIKPEPEFQIFVAVSCLT